MQRTLYHSLLRISGVVVALVLLFDSGLVAPGSDILSQNTQNYLANAVGVSAGVEVNEVNILTAELTKQTVALEQREQELVEREIAIQRNQAAPAQEDYSTYILSVVLFILLVLIVMNYGLDYARMRRVDLQYAKTG